MWDFPEQGYVRNPSDNEARLVAMALDSVARRDVELQVLVRPPLPQIQLAPPRFGYGDIVDRTPRVQDMFSADDLYGNPRVDYSQRLSGYSSTSYPSLNQY